MFFMLTYIQQRTRCIYCTLSLRLPFSEKALFREFVDRESRRRVIVRLEDEDRSIFVEWFRWQN